MKIKTSRKARIKFKVTIDNRTKNPNRLFECASELNKIAKAGSKEERNILIKKAQDCVIDSISEIALNCLKGNFPLKNCDFKKLKRQKNILRQLAIKSGVDKRKKILIQTGGFLPILIQGALAFLGSAAASYLKQKLQS